MVWLNNLRLLPCFHAPLEQIDKRASQAGVALLSVFLMASPFPHTQTICEVSFYGALLIGGILTFRFPLCRERDPLLTTLLLFGGWVGITSFIAINPLASLADFYSHLIKYVILVILLSCFFCSRHGITLLTWVAVASGTFFSTFVVVYFYGARSARLCSRMNLPSWPSNAMGGIMLFSLALTVPLYRYTTSNFTKKILLGFALILFVASLLTQSRATFISMVVMVIVLSYREKKFLLVALVLILIGLLFSPLANRFNNQDITRKALFLYSLEVINDYKLTGIGYHVDALSDLPQKDQGKYVLRIPEQYRKVVKFDWPHNILLDLSIRVGLGGTLIFILFLGLWLRDLVRLARPKRDAFIHDVALSVLAAFIMYTMKSLVEPVTLHCLEVIFYTMLAMTIILKRLIMPEPGISDGLLSQYGAQYDE